MSLHHLTLRQWRRRPLRAALTILSVAIAVTAVLGTSLAQTTVRSAYRQVSRKLEGPLTLEIVATAGGRFASESVPKLNDIPGVIATAPLVCRATSARMKEHRLRTLVVGLDAPPSDPAWKQIPLISGRYATEPNEVLLAADVANSLHIEPGERVVFLTRRGPRSASVVGLANPQSIRDLAAGATMVLPGATLQQWFASEGEIDRLRVLLDEHADREVAKQAIAAELPDDLIVQTPVGQMQLADEMLRSTELALRFAGALSLAMAAFIILNTLRMNFSERRSQLATLRAIGATQGQITGLLLYEGLWIGLIGALLGLPAGIGLSHMLSQAMQGLLDTDLPASAPRWEIVLAALTMGPLVSVFAAWLPARQSQRISPVEGMRDVDARQGERIPRWSIALALAAWIVAIAIIFGVVRETVAPEAAIPAGLLMLMAYIVLIPVVVRPIVRCCDRALRYTFGIEAHLAAEQLARRPTRTGLTAGVLVVAISNGLGLGNAILNNVDDVRDWYRRSMAGEFFLRNAASGDVALDDERAKEDSIVQELDQTPGVAHVVTMRFLTARAADQPAMCIVRDFPSEAELPWLIQPSEQRQLKAALSAGETVLSSVLARRLNAEVGDQVRFEVRGKVIACKVAAIVTDYNLGGMVGYLDRRAASSQFDLGPVDLFLIHQKPGTETEPLGVAVQTIAEQRGLIVQSYTKLRQELDQLIDGIVVSLWGLLAIGFVVGGFAVANTLTMSVLEQTRELGLLRVVGMTAWQVRKMVLLEALMLGVVGLLLGALAGVTTAIVIHLCNEPLLGRQLPFVFHFWLLALNALGCFIIVVVSGWAPSRRAARLPLLQVLAYE